MPVIDQFTYNLNNRKFIATKNSAGLSSAQTVFQYFQDGQVITGNYQGGEIKFGSLIGKQIAPNKIELRFQCITQGDALLSGQSVGILGENEEGLLTIDFEWNWLGDAASGSTSHYIEIA